MVDLKPDTSLMIDGQVSPFLHLRASVYKQLLFQHGA